MTVRLLELRVRIPPAAWISDSCKCCVLSGRGLCVGLITNLEETYQSGVSAYDCEALIMRRAWPTLDVAPRRGGGRVTPPPWQVCAGTEDKRKYSFNTLANSAVEMAGGHHNVSAAVHPAKRAGTYFTGGWVDLRASTDKKGKSLPHSDSIPGTSTR